MDPGEAKEISENHRTWTYGQLKSINEPSLSASMASHVFTFSVPMVFLWNVLIIDYTTGTYKIFDSESLLFGPSNS